MESRKSNCMKCYSCILARLMKSTVFQKTFYCTTHVHVGLEACSLELFSFSGWHALQSQPCTRWVQPGRGREEPGWHRAPDLAHELLWPSLPPKTDSVLMEIREALHQTEDIPHDHRGLTSSHSHKWLEFKVQLAEGGKNCQLCCVRISSSKDTVIAGVYVKRWAPVYQLEEK